MPTWNELFEHEEFRWQDPHEQVINLADELGDGTDRRVLDLGCGAGRHLVFLAGRNFRVTGLDLALNGLRHAQRWLADKGFEGSLALSDVTAIPCRSACFDVVLSTFVLYHNRMAGIRDAIGEVCRVLCPGGKALLTFLSKRSSRYGHGVEVEADTYLTDIGADAGQLHHFSDLQELARELGAFVVRRIELLEEAADESGRSSHWVVLLEKPATVGA